MAEDTARVELRDGQWAVIRTRNKVRDGVAQRMATNKRGFDDTYLNVIAGVQSRIVEWSFGDVTDEIMLDLDDADLTALLKVVAERAGAEGAGDPLVNSSDGSTPKKNRAERRRGNGASA